MTDQNTDIEVIEEEVEFEPLTFAVMVEAALVAGNLLAELEYEPAEAPAVALTNAFAAQVDALEQLAYGMIAPLTDAALTAYENDSDAVAYALLEAAHDLAEAFDDEDLLAQIEEQMDEYRQEAIDELIEEARTAITEGDHGTALVSVERALELDEENEDALALKAECYEALGISDEDETVEDDDQPDDKNS